MDTLLPWAAVQLLLLLLFSWRSEPAAAAASSLGARRFDSIFSFGDSFTDTGNNPVVFGWYSVFNPVMRPPYGSTFFGRPTGRNCDGRLIIDFLVPCCKPGPAVRPAFPGARRQLPPRRQFRRRRRHRHRRRLLPRRRAPRSQPVPTQHQPRRAAAVVRVAQALALRHNPRLIRLARQSALAPPVMDVPPSIFAESSQGTRLRAECGAFLGTSLFIVGSLGFNDYSFLLGNKRVQQVRACVSDVIASISTAIQRLIKHGATTLLVPGMLPAGCAPPILSMFTGADPDEYEPRTGCLKSMNELCTHHNSLLQHALRDIRAKHSDVEIIYADFFRPVMEMVESPGKFGFEGDALTICCGGPGMYHFNKNIFCGDPGATTCKDPSARVFWDSVHLTEAANRYIAGDWLSSINSTTSVSSQ